MTAYILTIGDEILIGQITDTNSGWMAQQLNLQGIRIVGKSSVGDVHDEIVDSIKYALSKADLVLTTGGLGATKDDITKKAIADFLGDTMIFHDETHARLTYFFKKVNREVSEMNKNSCFMPSKAKILNNDRGLAPAMWFDIASESGSVSEKKVLVSMPGVPFEMQHLMTDRVLPKLSLEMPVSPIVHRTVLTAGEGETNLAEKLSDFEDNLPKNIKLAYLPSLGTVRLRLTARGENEAVLQEQIEKLKTQMVELVKPTVAGFDDETMPEIIGKILRGSQLTLATAESCTGGYLAHLITGVSGSSDYYRGGIVSYANELKMNELSVQKETLTAHGAVSEETVREMVTGALKRYGSDIAVATTGIAGPDGGTPEKPVGTVWIAVGDKNNIVTFKWGADRGRAKNIEFASNIALNMVRKFVLNRK